jgi:gliding motility-associated-like protein
LNATYIISPEDVEAQTIQLTLAATGIGNCIGVQDAITLNIFPEGTVDVGSNAIACANNPELQLNAVLTGATEGIWTSNGSGTFAPDNTDPNATYVPSPADIVNASVNLVFTATNSCNVATDFLTLSFTPAPIVDAGPDQAVCDDILPFEITGSVTNAGGAQWSSSGSGFFQNANNLNTFYVASQADIDNGGVFLILTSTGNGNCFPVADSMAININTGVNVNAGPDREACADAGLTQLFGSVTNGSTTGVWTTSGNGTFSPNPQTLNAVYNFTPDDIANGSVILTLTSTNNGICPAVSDDFELTFGNGTFVYAGENITVCETQELVLLGGQISGETSTGTWTTSGTGTFFPSANSLNPSYEASAADIAGGSVVLTLTSTNSILCDEGSSDVVITFQSLPVANAGPNALVCGNVEPIQLIGSVTGAAGGIWTTSGTGSFLPNDSVVTALYAPTSTDSIIGNITLTLTTFGNGSCPSTSDEMNISFAGAVTPNAGPNVEICEDETSVDISGSTDGPGATQWTTSGTGSFTPDDTQLDVTYNPSADDIADGGVTLYLTVEGNGSCPSRVDSLQLTVDQLPEINVASSVDACTSSPEVSVASTVNFEDLILWTSNGGGTFSPSPNAANVIYTPTEAEVNSGSTTLTLTATSNGACGSVAENIAVTFIEPASVNAGSDAVLCSSDGEVVLNGAVSGSTTTGVWSTNSFGTFEPNTGQLDATYIFGQNDILVGFAQLFLTSTNNGPCPAVQDTVRFTINPAPVVNAGPDREACASSGVLELNGTATSASATNWVTLGDGVFLPDNESLDAAYIYGVSDEAVGEVILILTAEGLEGCASVSDTLIVGLSNPLIAAFSTGAACAGVETSFFDQTEIISGGISNWIWDFGNGNNSNQRNPTVTFGSEGSYDVTLIVQSTLGCNDTITQVVNVSERPVASFNVSQNPAPIEFEILFESTTPGGVVWDWNFGDGLGISDLPNPTYSYDEAGIYTVTMLVENEAGCTDLATRAVTIDGVLVLPPRLPNSFSPNGDDHNDIFFVRGGPFIELDFRVYDGWGREIFRTTNQDIGWDGTENGKQSPTGVYVYTIVAVNDLGQAFDYSGRITLLR